MRRGLCLLAALALAATSAHALDVRASEYHVSDNFWYQFFVPANASDVAQPQPVHLASARS